MNELSHYMVVLLSKWVKASTERRRIEEACGYPGDYGGDEEVLKDTKILLSIMKDLGEK